ncbi:DNA invertase Pin-like site-specific DNA recombinase [Dietzia sp. 2505]|uniref:recombinase family protein n=1 Tax=Dietzia sp. 2505 TaxID=3156457 RepID=UPI0033950F1C
MRIGYERIYPSDPDPARQSAALTDAGCMSIYTDDTRQTGAAQPQLTAALEHLRPGDTLTVTSLDRLAHHNKALVTHVAHIEDLSAHLHILDSDLHTRNDPDHIFFRTIAAIDEVNTTGRSQRIRRSITTAKEQGRRPGRPTIKKSKKIDAIILLAVQLDEHGNRRHTITDIARKTGVSRATVYRYINEYKLAP